MRQPNMATSAPVVRLELPILFGKLLMIMITWAAWTIIAGYWMLWAAILSALCWSALVSLWRVRVAQSYKRQDQIWGTEAKHYMFGKVTRLAQLSDEFVKALMGRTGHFIGALENQLLLYNPWARKAGHICVFGPARTGKSSTSVLGTLLNPFNIIGELNFSVWINDCKGELYFVSSGIRRWLGHRIIALNPFGVGGIQKDTLNPFDVVVDAVVRGSGKAHEWADIIAQAMIREPEGGKGVENFFFRKNGRRPQDHS